MVLENLINDLCLNESQLDELWGFSKKKESSFPRRFRATIWSPLDLDSHRLGIKVE